MVDRRLRCATWNVHRAKGTDGKVDPDRVAACVNRIAAEQKLQILALQEADGECPPHAGILDVAAITAQTGLRYAHDPSLRWGTDSTGFLGTVVFLSPEMTSTHADVIDLPGHCHRGAVAIETEFQNRNVRIVSAHLSLTQVLRAVQMRVIGQYLRRRPPMQTVLLGDVNEWRPWGGVMFSAALVGIRLRGPAPATFPSRWPVLPLDRIFTDAPGEVRDAMVLKSPAFTIASDHLPLCADVTVP